MDKEISVAFAAFEATPFMKSGGLGDVSGALPPALSERGCRMQVFLPKAGTIPSQFKEKMTHVTEFIVPLGWRRQYCGIEKLEERGVTWYFLDNEYYFFRDRLYGFYDDGERIAFFCKAVLESLSHIPGMRCDILHCNDWHTALMPVFLREFYRGMPQYDRIRTVFTVHNLKFQGVFPPEILENVLGLAEIPAAAEQLDNHGTVNYMKGALCYSDLLTTVSRTYAREICSAYFGEGMEDIFNRRRDRLHGILNGIDTEEYNPAADGELAAVFSRAQLDGKAADKAALQKELGLEIAPELPLLVMVGRLTEQKGLDLLLRILEELLNGQPVEVAVLGTGDVCYEGALLEIAGRHPGRMRAIPAFDQALAHRFYGGADLLVMPSRFEPCGLAQMIAMRYGTLPVVRETGGLRDSVIPYNRFTGEGTGFGFANFNAHELLFTLQNAIRLFREDSNAWHRLTEQAMAVEVGWQQSAGQYRALYETLCQERDGSL